MFRSGADHEKAHRVDSGKKDRVYFPSICSAADDGQPAEPSPQLDKQVVLRPCLLTLATNILRFWAHILGEVVSGKEYDSPPGDHLRRDRNYEHACKSWRAWRMRHGLFSQARFFSGHILYYVTRNFQQQAPINQSEIGPSSTTPMCGLTLTITPAGSPPWCSFGSDSNKRLLSAQTSANAARGPDAQGLYVRREVTPTSEVVVSLGCGILGLRGSRTAQPLIGKRGALAWNGQVFGGFDVAQDDNDTRALFARLETGETIESLLQHVQGPWVEETWV